MVQSNNYVFNVILRIVLLAVLCTSNKLITSPISINNIAVGIHSHHSTVDSITLSINHWWVSGTVGCMFSFEKSDTSTSLPIGMSICEYPHSLTDRKEVRVALSCMVLAQRFKRDWYVMGDDDIWFFLLNLSQWLTNFDQTDQW